MISDKKVAVYHVLLKLTGQHCPQLVDIIFSNFKIVYSHYLPEYIGQKPKLKTIVCEYRGVTERKHWYKNGNPRSYAKYLDGKIHGEFLEWNEHGGLSRKCNYKKGNLVGHHTMWYENYTVSTETKDNVFRCWFPNGRLSKGTQLGPNGERHGFHIDRQNMDQCRPLVEWYEHGEKVDLGLGTGWKDGIAMAKVNGVWVQARMDDDDAITLHHTKYSRGNTKESFYLKNGVLHGKVSSFHEFGSLKAICWYKDGVKHGAYREWHPSYGTGPRCKGGYVNGLRQGEWRLYHCRGGLDKLIMYKDDQVVWAKSFSRSGHELDLSSAVNP